MVFGDFSGFDATMRSDFLRASFDLIEEFHRACGADELHCKMIRALSYDVVFPLVEYNGDLIQLNGKNPSGQPLTVIINGIINCMYMRFCYLKLNPDQEITTFKKNVRLLTYGDDNGMGVAENCEWFNHSSIQSILATIGVTYTMADKQSESRKYIHIDEADFLKRKWRYESDTKSMVCPLAEDSIIKSLMIGVKKSASLSREEHAASIISSAQLEYFWHGREIFEDRTKMLAGFIKKYDLQDYMPRPLQSWEVLVHEYNERSTFFLKNQVGIESTTCQLCDNPKSNALYSYCPVCKAMDQCMLCGETCTSICKMEYPNLWFCFDCYYTFFYLEEYDYTLINRYFMNACRDRLRASYPSDLPHEWFDRTANVERALAYVWDRCIYICVPSTTNGPVSCRLGFL